MKPERLYEKDGSEIWLGDRRIVRCGLVSSAVVRENPSANAWLNETLKNAKASKGRSIMAEGAKFSGERSK